MEALSVFKTWTRGTLSGNLKPKLCRTWCQPDPDSCYSPTTYRFCLSSRSSTFSFSKSSSCSRRPTQPLCSAWSCEHIWRLQCTVHLGCRSSSLNLFSLYTYLTASNIRMKNKIHLSHWIWMLYYCFKKNPIYINCNTFYQGSHLKGKTLDFFFFDERKWTSIKVGLLWGNLFIEQRAASYFFHWKQHVAPLNLKESGD